MDWHELMKDQVVHRECSNLVFRIGKKAVCKKYKREITYINGECLKDCSCRFDGKDVPNKEIPDDPGLYTSK